MQRFMKPKILVSTIILIGIVVVGWRLLVPPAKENVVASTDEYSVSINIPKLSAAAAQGQLIFNKNCSRCHGTNAIGSDKGPPLIFDIYNPGHHGDNAFYRAAKTGSPQHHWTFGNMPPQPQVNDADIARIIRFIRETQEANGIFYRQHKM
jgi:cytochrome c